MKFFAVIFAFILSLLTGCESANRSGEPQLDGLYKVLFQRELENRANARQVTRLMADAEVEERYRPFWMAYKALEDYNYACYQVQAERAGLSVEPTLKTRIIGRLSYLGFKYLPEYAVAKLHAAVKAYLPDLKRLAEVAPDSDERFFKYVVFQEEKQLAALDSLIKEDSMTAVSLLRDVEKQFPNCEFGS